MKVRGVCEIPGYCKKELVDAQYMVCLGVIEDLGTGCFIEKTAMVFVGISLTTALRITFEPYGAPFSSRLDSRMSRFR